MKYLEFNGFIKLGMSSQNNSVNGLTTITTSSEDGWQKAGTRKQRRSQRLAAEEAEVTEVVEVTEVPEVEEEAPVVTEPATPSLTASAAPSKSTWASRLKAATTPAAALTPAQEVSHEAGVCTEDKENAPALAPAPVPTPARKTPTAGAPTPARKTYPAPPAAKTPSSAPKQATAPGAPVKSSGQKPATAYKGTPRINRTLDFSKAPRAERTERPPRPNADAYKAALTAAEDAFFNECLCEVEAKGNMKGVPVEQRRRVALDDLHAQAGCILNWSAVAVNAPIFEDFDPVTIGDSEVVFSRRKFAENRFFQRRLRDYYLANLPDNCWVAFRLVGKAAAPGQPSTEGLLIRVGNRIA